MNIVETLIRKAPLLAKWDFVKLLGCLSKPVAYSKAIQNRNKDIITLNSNRIAVLLITNLETHFFHNCKRLQFLGRGVGLLEANKYKGFYNINR